MSSHPRYHHWAFAAIAVLGLASACGSDDDGSNDRNRDDAGDGGGAGDGGQGGDGSGGTPASGGGTGETCASPLVDCDGECVNTDRDPAHCGSCTGSCDPGFSCDRGECVISCPEPQIACEGSCRDPNTDREHCGASSNCAGGNAGTACAPGEICSGGACAPTCQDGLIDCDGECVDPDTNRAFCGARGDCTSPPPPAADAGAADAGAGDASVPEGGIEAGAADAGADAAVDAAPDAPEPLPENSAGVACEGNEVCALGACEAICPTGQILCDGQCLNPNVDRSHCGATYGCRGADAGVVCGEGEFCAAGTCAAAEGCVGALGYQVFENGMVGCAGQAVFADRSTLCDNGFFVCTAQQWVDNFGGVPPEFNFWTDDLLRYSGDDGECSVSTATGTDCGADTPMRVCADRVDPLGNDCNWIDCGLETVDPKEHFGGCSGNTTAGTLCCPVP